MFEQMSSPIVGHLTVAEAALRLEVTANDVRRLVDAGELPAAKVGRQWLIPAEAVEHRRELGPRKGRRLSPASAWGVLFLADDKDAPWLSPDARWRARGRLAQHSVADQRDRLINRGRPSHYRAHPSMLSRIRQDHALMLTGVSAASALHLGLVGGSDQVDAYIDQELLEALVARYHLRRSADPNVTLRLVPKIGWAWPPAPVAPRSAVALDLLDHSEPRVRDVGRELLAQLR
jgi:excisionase family DNA binding protein